MDNLPSPRTIEIIEEIKDMLDCPSIRVLDYYLNPDQGYVVTCTGPRGDHITVNHHGFGGTGGPWTPELVSIRFQEQRRLLGGISCDS